MSKPMKAYVVSDEEGVEFVFATNSATARREGGAELGLEFEEVESCRRAPWADQYYGKGGIPVQAMLDNGYYSGCCVCGDPCDPTSGGTFEGVNAWCGSGCRDNIPDA